MGHDVVRVMKGREGEMVRDALHTWMDGKMGQWKGKWGRVKEVIQTELDRLEEMWMQLGADELKFRGRDLLELLAWIVAAVLLVEDAERDGDEVAALRARRWMAKKSTNDEAIAWEETVALNRKLVFGRDGLSSSAKL